MKNAADVQSDLHPFRTQAVKIALFDGCDAEETLLFGEAARAQRCVDAPPQAESLCRHCGSELGHPLDWEHPTDELWLLTLRCPECECEWVVAMDQPVIERFIAHLHAQKRALARDLARLSTTRFAEEAKRFTSALHADRVLPADF